MARVVALCMLAVLGFCSSEVGDEVSFLQMSVMPLHQHREEDERMDVFAPLAHYWPNLRGHSGQYSITKYPVITSSGNLSDSLLWTLEFKTDMLFSSVIDYERNVYVAGMKGLRKVSPQGKVLWTSRTPTWYAIVVGNAVCGQNNMGARIVFCLSLKTGRPFWSRVVFPIAGLGGNQIGFHNGVLMVAAGEFHVPGLTVLTGKANDRVIGMNASTGKELWQFKVSCGLWMFSGLFPDEDTTLFQDECGGVYRIGLFNGSLIWYAPGAEGTLSDGAATLGPDGSTYSCSMAEGSQVVDNNDPLYPGIMRKFRLSDGAVLWTATTPYPCTNIPTVTADGRTVVVAPGAIPAVDGPFYYQREQILSLPPKGRERLHQLYDRMQRNGTLRALYNMTDLTGAIMGFDTRTGELLWRHEVPPSGSITAAGDQERNWNMFIEQPSLGLWGFVKERLENGFLILPHCGPAHWTPPTVDLEGKVYIGDSVGEIRVYDPKTDKRLDFHLDDGFVPGGIASAPGLMVFTSCETVYAFKAEGA